MLNKDKINNIIQFLINYLLMPFVCVFLLLICLLIFATTSHAQGLPVDPYFNNTALTPEDVVTYLQACDTQYGLDYMNGEYFIVQGDYRIFGRYQNIFELQFFVFKIPDTYSSFSTSILESNYSTFDWSNYPDGISCSWDCHRYALKLENGVWTPYGSAVATTPIKYGVSEIETNFLTYTPSTICISTKNIYVSSNSANKIINIDNTTPVQVGLAVPPINDPGLQVINQLTGQPYTKPTKPIINQYSWTTYNNPPIDTSSAETLLESLWDSLTYNFSYLFNNLGGLFDTLTDNISNFVTYIGDSLYYVSNNIVSAIQDFATDLYNNMSALVQPIFDKVNYITQPIDSSAISAAFNDNGLIQVKNDFIDFFNDFDDLIRNTPEPDTFDLIINVQNIRTFYDFGVHSPVVLHLGNNLNGTLKTAFRAFLWVLVIVGSIFLTEKNLSAWIKGGGFSDK